jgi:transposase-like protein
MIEDDGRTIACPACGSLRVRPSKRLRPGDLMLALRLQRAYRCRQCRSRFPVTTGVFSRSGNLRAALRRRVRRLLRRRPERVGRHTLVILLGAAALVALFLYWLARMPDHGA